MPLAVTSIEIQNVPRSWVQEGRCGQKKKWRRYKKWFAPDKKLSKYRFVQTSSRNLKFLAHCLRKQAERNWFHITEWLSASTKLDSILSSRFKFPPVPSLFTAPIPLRSSINDVMSGGGEVHLYFFYFDFPRVIRFVYSEKAANFCEIFILLLFTVHTDKSKVKISQNFAAFSEYMNFKSRVYLALCPNKFTSFPKINAILWLKFIYSEKATKFCKIFTLLLTGTT